MNNEECDRVPSQGERPEESRFWERYWEAVRRHGKVAATTQNQALNALVFFFREGLKVDPGQIGEFEYAKRPRKLPVGTDARGDTAGAGGSAVALDFAGEAVVWQRAAADGRGSVTGAGRGYGTVPDRGARWERSERSSDDVGGGIGRPTAEASGVGSPTARAGSGGRLRRGVAGLGRWTGSIPKGHGNGDGNGCFRRRNWRWIREEGRCGGIILIPRSCNGRCWRPRRRRGW